METYERLMEVAETALENGVPYNEMAPERKALFDTVIEKIRSIRALQKLALATLLTAIEDEHLPHEKLLSAIISYRKTIFPSPELEKKIVYTYTLLAAARVPPAIMKELFPRGPNR